MEEYEVHYYRDSRDLSLPVLEYVKSQDDRNRAKIYKYIEHLRVSDGYLEEPLSKHIKGKIRELRVDFSNNHHRIFYFAFYGKKIILLHAFTKRTDKTPVKEIKRAENNYHDFINNPKLYDKEESVRRN